MASGATMPIPELRVLIGRQIGLSESFDGSMTAYGNLTRDQQIALTQGMIAYIQQHPANFTAGQLATANAESGRAATLTPQDDSFDFSAFVAELETNAGNVIGAPVVAIGQGVSQTVQMIGTLLPAAVLLAVVVYAWPHLSRNLSAK